MKTFLLKLLGLSFLATSLQAQLPLGTVSKVKQITCTGLPGNCFTATVAAQGVPAVAMEFKLLPSSSGTTTGTVLLTPGLGALSPYELDFKYGSYLIQRLQGMGYRVIEIWCPGYGNAGYYTGPGGPLLAAGRWATLANWLSGHYAQHRPFCATGNSAGAATLGYALSQYGLDKIFNFVEPTSGPVFSRVDYGCQGNGPRTFSACEDTTLTWTFGMAGASGLLDPSFGNSDCSTATETGTLQFQNEFFSASIDNGNQLTWFTTTIKVLSGGLDMGMAPLQGANWLSDITSATMVGCVPDAPHEICDVQDGAEQIAADMQAYCVP